MSGADISAGSRPSARMSSGSIAPISAPVRQMPITANVTAPFSFHKNPAGTFASTVSGVRKCVRATDSTPSAAASASATSSSRRSTRSQSRA